MDQRPLPVRGHLVNQGLTVTDLAARLGITRQHLASVLNGKVPLTRELASAIARDLGLGLDEAGLLLGSPSTWSAGRQSSVA